MKKFLGCVLVLALSVCAGCNDFERTSFNTLSATKAVLDTAQSDYEAGTIPKTKCAFSIITDAKTADTLAVEAMIVYEQQKGAKQDLTTQTALIIGDLSALAPLVVRVKLLMDNPISACGG